MRKRIATLTALAMLCSANAEPVPRYASSLPQYSGAARVSGGAMRLRISIATEGLHTERSVRVGDVLLCKASNCFRAHVPSYVDLFDTSAGTATVIADVVIPLSTITDVFFVEPAGGPAIAGHLKFKEPLVIEGDFQGIELFFGIRKQQAAGKTSFIPAQMASTYFHPDNLLLYYLPTTRTVAKLPLGVTATFPAGALHTAHVFHVGANNTGDMYPSVKIFPYVKLNKPVVVDAPAIPGGHSSYEMIRIASMPEDKHLYAPQLSAPGPNGRVEIHETKTISTRALEDSVNDPVKSKARYGELGISPN